MPHPAGIAGEIDQVLMNVLANAVQAIAGEGEIQLRTWANDGSVYVEVRDDGRGIPPEIRDRVFEPFFTTKDGAGNRARARDQPGRAARATAATSPA